MEALVAGLVAGLLGGLADYWLGVGFGLAVAPLLLALGLDPRSAAGSIAVAQVVSSIPAFLAHRAKGNIRGAYMAPVAVLAASSTLAALAATLLLSRAGSVEARLVGVSMLVALLLATYKPLPATSRAYGLAALGAAAGAVKAVLGAGYTALLVAAKTGAGLDARTAIAATPLSKLPAFTVTAIGYAAAGLVDPALSLAMAIGALVSAPISAHVLRATGGKAQTSVIRGLLAAYLAAQLYHIIGPPG